MGAIKSLRESSVLLSNLNMSSYDELAERIYFFSRVEECLYYDTDEEGSMGWVEKMSLTVLKPEIEILWQALVCLPLRKSIVFSMASYVGWLSWITGWISIWS